jgi:hypothetical protein
VILIRESPTLDCTVGLQKKPLRVFFTEDSDGYSFELAR